MHYMLHVAFHLLLTASLGEKLYCTVFLLQRGRRNAGYPQQLEKVTKTL